MAQVNPNNKIETKSDIFPWDIFKFYTIFRFTNKMVMYFSDFKNQNVSVLELNLTRKMEIKQNQSFSHRTY